MPAMTNTNPDGGGGGSEVEVLFSRMPSSLASVAKDLGQDTMATLRLALHSADPSRPAAISQDLPPPVKSELRDPDEDSSDDDEDEAGLAAQPSTSASSAPPARAFGPAPNVGATKNLGFTEALGPDDVPPPPAHPTDPDEIRKLMRSKMHRCSECKNRFVEKNLLERHLAAKHPEAHAAYMEEQIREMELQRLSELEQVRREEILSGGFIPPADEIDAYLSFDHIDPAKIPKPNPDDPPPRVDRRGSIVLPPRKFPYRKKVSPQCPFCDKRFRNENSLKKHIVKKHPLFMDFVQCNRCYKCLPRAEDLRPGGHDCELGHICFECTPMRNMCTPERLLSHRAKFHRGKNSGFRCNECGRKCLTPRKLRKHKKMSHIVTKPYKCHFCDEYFPTDTQASLHERIHTGKVKYECRVCDYRANRWTKLERHRREEHGFLCSICSEKIAEWSQLKYHTLNEHSGYLSSQSQASKCPHLLSCLLVSLYMTIGGRSTGSSAPSAPRRSPSGPSSSTTPSTNTLDTSAPSLRPVSAHIYCLVS